MNDVERLAVEQAVYNAIGADVKTGVAGNLRGRVTDRFLRLYEQTGATGFEVRLNGRKVGTFGFDKVKGREGYVDHEFVVWDMKRLLMEADDDGTDLADFLRQWQVRHLAEAAEEYFRATGEVPDGCRVVEREVPPVPDGIKPGGKLRVSADKVADALGPALPSTLAGLLAGGGES